MTAFTWTPEAIAALSRHAVDGMSAKDSAYMLQTRFGGTLTKGAVGGMCRRRGIVRNSPSASKARQDGERARREARMEPVNESVFYSAPVEDSPGPKTILEIRDGLCRWPLSDTRPQCGSSLFCGDPVRDEACSYCRKHAAIAFQPMKHARDWDRRLARGVA